MVSFNEESDGAPEHRAVPQASPEVDEIGDDKLVKIAIKIRDRIAEVTKEHEKAVKVLKDQQETIVNALIARLQARGASQTKTDFGTAFLGENMQATIADASTFKTFCLEEPDPLGFVQARVKLERLREWMKEHEGRIPPGINLFREVTLNLRAPTK